jgi:hypothetical protein
MNRRTLLWTGIVALLALSAQGNASAEEDGGLGVSQAVIATAVEDRVPQGGSETFSSDVGRLYAFSRITGIAEETIVRHQWFYGDRMMTEIRLPVKPPAWRTYSSKTILPSWTGQWEVKILDKEGRVLTTLPFTVHPSVPSSEEGE